MDITAVLVSFCLASAIITYGLGLCVYIRNPGSAVNRLFLLTMLSASYWAAGEFMIWQSSGAGEVGFWLKASALWTFTIALLVHFILVFTRHQFSERKNLPYVLAFLYLPAAATTVTEIFTDSIFTVVQAPGQGYIYVPVTDSPAYLAESILFVCLMGFSIYVGISSWLNQPPGRVRQQNLLISIGIVIVVISGAMSAFFLPLMGIHFPNTVFIGIVCFSGIIAYAMIRQGLFTLSPESAAANIIRTMPDGLLLADHDGRIIIANTSAEVILARKKDELIGRLAGSVLPKESARILHETIEKEGTVSDLEAVLDLPEYRVVSIAMSRITSPEGEQAGTILILRDITGRKASERSLRLAKDQLSLLSQLTRHDVTNLISALNAYVQLLSEKTDDPVAADYIAACTGIIDRIEGHLRFSREYEKIGEHEPAWQSLDETVLKAKEDLAPATAEITSRLPPLRIYADPLLYKVVYNLLENALRHGGEGLDRIEITAEEKGTGTLLVVFGDNGAGVPDEEKEQIFQRGFGKNTGLGLTLAREILAVTDIRLIENGVYGKGARFEMQIPPQSWRRG